jgi:tryptophanyl-tRNA synthetase
MEFLLIFSQAPPLVDTKGFLNSTEWTIIGVFAMVLVWISRYIPSQDDRWDKMIKSRDELVVKLAQQAAEVDKERRAEVVALAAKANDIEKERRAEFKEHLHDVRSEFKEQLQTVSENCKEETKMIADVFLKGVDRLAEVIEELKLIMEDKRKNNARDDEKNHRASAAVDQQLGFKELAAPRASAP